MNIYISDDTLARSARNLDTYTLGRQLAYLSSIVSQSIRENEDIQFFIKDIMGGLKLLERPPIKVHDTYKWANISPVHFMFCINYYLDCYSELKRRNITFVGNIFKQHKTFLDLYQTLNRFIPVHTTGDLYDIKLYRKVPSEFDNEPDTIKAYQRYLTKKWKDAIIEQKQYEAALLASNGEKIRKPRPLRWEKAPLLNIPHFARTELLSFIEELDNAKREQTNPTASSSITEA